MDKQCYLQEGGNTIDSVEREGRQEFQFKTLVTPTNGMVGLQYGTDWYGMMWYVVVQSDGVIAGEE